MSILTLFLLGQKGLATARAAIQPEYVNLINLVVIGEDKNLKDDCSETIRQLCLNNGVQYKTRKEYTFENHRNLELDASKKIGIASGWRWMIGEKFKPLLVIHDSLLPKYRGFNPLVTALLNRDEIIGATAIIANMEFDKGNIVLNGSIPINYPININEAIVKLSCVIENITTSLLQKIRSNECLEGIPQDEAMASYSIWRDSDDYWIDWSESSSDISHFINCVSYPYAGASTCMGKSIIRILKATPVPDVAIANRHPGKVLFMELDRPLVICGTGLLKIEDAVDDEGRPALPLPRFRVRFTSPKL
jgi:methionyl-tRNA formyltransferase